MTHSNIVNFVLKKVASKPIDVYIKNEIKLAVNDMTDLIKILYQYDSGTYTNYAKRLEADDQWLLYNDNVEHVATLKRDGDKYRLMVGNICRHHAPVSMFNCEESIMLGYFCCAAPHQPLPTNTQKHSITKIRSGEYDYRGWKIELLCLGGVWALYAPGEDVACDGADTLKQAKELIDGFIDL